MMRNEYIIPLEEYKDKEVELMASVSYEERAVISIQRAIQKLKIKSCVLLASTAIFESKEERDIFGKEIEFTENKWRENYHTILKLLKDSNIKFVEIKCSFYQPLEVVKKIDEVISGEREILFDISCVPKHVILSILKWTKRKPFSFLYTRPKEYKSGKAEISVGVKEIGVLQGFEGEIKVGTEDYLVLVLGFEGGRALTIFRHFEPYKAIALIGDPDPIYRGSKRKFFLERARERNASLLNMQRVIEKTIPSLDPYGFYQKLAELLQPYKSGNIIIAPIGTKIQTLGLFLYHKKHPEAQIIYSIPLVRKVSSEGAEDTSIYLINEFKNEKVTNSVFRS